MIKLTKINLTFSSDKKYISFSPKPCPHGRQRRRACELYIFSKRIPQRQTFGGHPPLI